MNLIDALVIALAIYALWRGWRRGLLLQVFELGGGFLGLLLGIVAGRWIADEFTSTKGIQAALISLIVVFIGLTLGQAAGFVFGHRFGTVARRAKFGSLDSWLGSGFGVAVTLVSFWLIGSLLVAGPFRPLAKQLRGSAVLSALATTLPDPPNLLVAVRQYLQTSGFPQVFAGLPRPIGQPAPLPSNQVASRAINAADQSTVRISTPACGGTQVGSGWIVQEGTVVTNAHVVAGGQDISVGDRGGVHEATVVLFDENTDIAILKVSDLSGNPLRFDTGVHDRNTVGATLGYPGAREGSLVGKPAAVQARFEARGKDIYGEDFVTREVYELRARVREGDSGGPFVLPDGRVAGVVFAASTTDGSTGYALTGAEVQDEIEAGATRTSAVPTGRCTH